MISKVIQHQLGRFLLVGASSFLLDVGLNYLIWFSLDARHSLPTALAIQGIGQSASFAFGLVKGFTYCCGMVLNYSLNRKWTFKAHHEPVHKQAVKFVLVSLLALAVSAGVGSLVASVVGANSKLGWLAAVVLGNGLATVCSYLLHRSVTFKQRLAG